MGEEIEYYDRKHKVHGIGNFYPVTSLEELNEGDNVIAPTIKVCANELKPILLTVKGFSGQYHVRMQNGYGSIAFDLLYKERD